MVPPDASSNAPTRRATAPVNEPFSWPNSSDSSRFGGIAPQSTTRNGPVARVDARWIASAATPLPVPVSPSSSTVTSECAARSSSANAVRIATDAPTSLPNALPADTGSRFDSRRELEAQPDAPELDAASPRARTRRDTRTPSTTVPLRLSRSLTCAPSSAMRTSQWKRDTVASSTTRSFDGWNPIEQRSDDDSHVRPAFGPSTTVSRKRRTAPGGSVELPSSDKVCCGSLTIVHLAMYHARQKRCDKS